MDSRRFYYILDTARNNAMAIYALVKEVHPRKVNTFQFTVKLAESLVGPHLQKRKATGLQADTLAKRKLAGVKEPSTHLSGILHPPFAPKPRHCKHCLQNLMESPSLPSGPKIKNAPRRPRRKQPRKPQNRIPPIVRPKRKQKVGCQGTRPNA